MRLEFPILRVTPLGALGADGFASLPLTLGAGLPVGFRLHLQSIVGPQFTNPLRIDLEEPTRD